MMELDLVLSRVPAGLPLTTVAGDPAVRGPRSWSADALFDYGRTGLGRGLDAIGLGLVTATTVPSTRHKGRTEGPHDSDEAS